MTVRQEVSVATRIQTTPKQLEGATATTGPKDGQVFTSRLDKAREAHSPLSRWRPFLCVLVLLGILHFWFLSTSDDPLAGGDDSVPDPTLNYSYDRLRFRSEDPPVPMKLEKSRWTCTYEGDTSLKAKKSRQCVVSNVCVDDQGLFLLSHPTHDHSNRDSQPSTFPEVNLMSSRESADYYWPPRFRSIVGEGVSFPIHFKDETVFVYGIFRPGHLSHFLYDGMLPLYSTMKRFGGTTSSWLLRHAEYLGENLKDQALWEMEAILPHGKEIVLQPFEVMNASFQVLPPAKNTAPICFKRAVIGLGSQCGLNYCEHSTPAEVFQAYSRQIQEYYWPSSERWQEHLLLREQQAKIEKEQTKLGDRSLAISPTKCIRSARYYNFDGLGNSIPDQKEPRVRQGQRYPDLLETDPTGRITAMPVIAILEREGTRSVLNLDKVISTITRTGHFRLKVLSYDYGCGIPETAYLMRDVHILISPHGNALGGSIWMPSTLSPPSSTSSTKPFFPTVISIDSTRYYESWFQWTTTSMSQRFLIHRCGPAQSNHARIEEINSEVCPFHRDMELAQSALGKADLVLDTETEQKDMLELTGPEFPIDLWMKYGGEPINTFLNDYWKSLSRYADPVRLLKVLYQIRDENIANEGGNKSYLQLCRENKCCAPDCSGVMHRNIVGPLRAYDQDLSEERWGQLRQNKEHDLFVKSGETLKDWIP